MTATTLELRGLLAYLGAVYMTGTMLWALLGGE